MAIYRIVATLAATGLAFLAGLYYCGVLSAPVPTLTAAVPANSGQHPVVQAEPLDVEKAGTISKFVGPKGDFRIWFPVRPEAGATAVTDGIMRGQQFTSSDDEHTFQVVRFELQERHRNNQKFLDGMVSGFTKRATVLQPAKRIALGDCPGFEVIFVHPTGLTFRVRGYVLGNRAFTVAVMAKSKEGIQDRDAEKFLASLEILPL